MSTRLDDRERRELRRKARAAMLDALTALNGKASRNEIEERALADGGFSTSELLEPAPMTAAACYERMVDHDLSWALIDLKRDGLIRNPERGTWQLAAPVTHGDTEPLAGPVDETRIAELHRMSYAQYILTPEWRRTRAAALLHAGNCCSMNPAHTHGLEVQHRTRDRLGAETAEDVIVLCPLCRRLHRHAPGRANPNRISLPTPTRTRDVGSLQHRVPKLSPVRSVGSVASRVSRDAAPAAYASLPPRANWLRRMLAS